MQNKRAKFQNKIKSSTVVQLGQHYYGENKNLTQDHSIECSSEQLQLFRDSVTGISKVYERNQKG